MDTLPSRRGFLALAATTGALASLPAFTAGAAPQRPAEAVAPDPRHRLWWQAPADEHSLITQGLPIGNGRLGALATNDPGRELLLVTDATMWTGGRNDTLDADGQFPYGRDDFGSLTLLARLAVDLPGHDLSAVSGYRRTLDLAQGVVTTSYVRSGVTYRRQLFASRPDDVIVLHFTQDGGGQYTGTLTLQGTHGETGGAADSFTGSFPNGLTYGAAVTAHGNGGSVRVDGDHLIFSGCRELTVILSGGTDYAPDATAHYRDPSLDPRSLARAKVRAAARHSADTLLRTHTADHRALFDRFSLSLGTSTDRQRSLDTWERIQARARDGEPDPELEAVYVQFGRYLMISGSRGSLPLGLQGLWLDGNDPDWMGDYHTDINLQMNYWTADRAGLSPCFDALTDYCLAQLPSWTDLTRRLFGDPRNRYRNSSGRNAGWTLAISTNPNGGGGWWWHPAGNAWLANTLFEHYEFTHSRTHLAKIYPLLKGACEFWEARLLTTTLPDTGREVLVADSDWSPEQGPLDAKGITYAQELVWALFGNYRTAAAELGRDADYAATVGALRERLYLPVVSPKTGRLEEWMSPDDLGETTHRHLSPLIGLFPGDRIRPDGSTPAGIVTGATALLTARGMNSFGWANAWRALCWARLKNADKAYQLVVTNLRPSEHGGNGSAPNLFDIYETSPGRGIFQIDANLGTPAAVTEMLLYSRPGHLELLPALPDAWAAVGSVTGAGARGGFVVDLHWRNGTPTEVRIRSIGGTMTSVGYAGQSRTVRIRPGESVTLRDFAR
ncbi:glycosyl hydrolase family 95 catalytic domain-containing protein [Streptomyces camelliae]|uniref:Glycoside hydrolase N-terminal domain-containing protein n=1 Tax=Streptomyces camelliae TaxID=3004093 RepID=A0ABY7PH16_9ACTN|nr:glycoside hydrolase N-terminal domain-containing protein [Streptomyces sp. HUAS 2-6]WBO68201.1 glycoside hydrolase N-terminal domain-containing protein [Streptomyces sp. HUAS 2-6]